MRKPGRFTAALAALAIAAALSATFASAASDQIVAVTGSPCCTFTAPSYSIDAGTIASFQNADPDVSHDVTAFQQKGPDGKPLFASPTVKNTTVAVDGTQYLAPGSYVFFCTIHGFQQMHATLVVGGSGSPVARPKIDVTIPAQTLLSVRRTGRLKVKVRAVTASQGVSVTVKKGARLIASAKDLNLSKGATRTLRLALTGAGRAALKKGKSAGVSAQGTVPFGMPDTVRRTLR
jgi:plastocyanin